MTRKTIIVATPNTTQSKQISDLIDEMPDFGVIAKTRDLMNTYNQVESQLPTAVLISDSLANLPEFEVMRALFSALDVRWLVLTAPNKSHRSSPTVNPGSDLFSVPGNASSNVIEGQLRSLTRSAQQRRPIVKKSDQKNSYLVDGPEPEKSRRPPKGSLPASGGKICPARPLVSGGRASMDPIVLIGASTGGVDALLTVLSSFPANCPPTLIVQHTGAGFGASLAGLLDRQSAARILLAGQEQPLQRGTVLIGAGTRMHLILKGGSTPTAACVQGGQMSGHMPSVDVLFKSAITSAPKVAAALLTGMGKDGAQGLLELRNAGATTYAQDEASSVVYGMPRAAVEIGAAQTILPIDKIGPALLRGPSDQRRQPRKVLS